MNYIIAVDVGYGFTKYCIGQKKQTPKKNSFPTIVNKKLMVNNIELNDHKTNDILINIDDNIFEIGNYTSTDFLDNIFTLGNEFHGSIQWKAIIYKILADCYPKGFNKDDKYHLIIGLPLNQMINDSLLIQEMKKPIKFKDQFNNTYNYKIDSVKVLPQGAGSIYTFDKNIFDYDICIIDIGHYTIDIAIFEEGIYSNSLSFSINEGTFNISKKILEMLKQNYNINDIPHSKLEKQLIKGKISYKGEIINLEPYKKNIGIDYAIKIDQLLKSKLGSMYELIHNFIVIGGGVNLVFDGFNNNKMFTCELKDSNYRNALGYYNYAQSYII